MQTNKKNIGKTKYFSYFLIAAALLGFGYYIFSRSGSSDISGTISQNTVSQCKVEKIKFYYLKGCSWCEKIKQEGTIEKIKQLGIQVEEIDASVGPIRDKIEGTPTFVINGTVYTGYRTFDDLKKLLQCPLNETGNTAVSPISNQPTTNNQPQNAQNKDFKGEKGAELILTDGKIQFDATDLNDGKAKFFNVKMPNGKIVYFFAVKDQYGVYRAAANACQVCYTERKGFHQEGNEIVCNNCGNRYPLEKIATEKGGCNPGPINPNLKIVNGKIIITQAEIEQVSDLF